ncbi:hypothetical protein SHIRM173S_11775 [Streptomyces hirsutus]
MSMMNFLGRATVSGSPARSPLGLGASYVPSASQKSCQRASISAARAAV